MTVLPKLCANHLHIIKSDATKFRKSYFFSLLSTTSVRIKNDAMMFLVCLLTITYVRTHSHTFLILDVLNASSVTDCEPVAGVFIHIDGRPHLDHHHDDEHFQFPLSFSLSFGRLKILEDSSAQQNQAPSYIPCNLQHIFVSLKIKNPSN